MKRWRDSASIAALPVVTRGLLMELATHADDEGWLRLGTNDRAALWRYLAAHPNERRHLSRHLDALVSGGLVVEASDGWQVPGHASLRAPVGEHDPLDDELEGVAGVYLVRCEVTGLTKIGRSSNVRQRVRSLQTGSPTPLQVLCVLSGDPNPQALEGALHSMFRPVHVRGEWFRLAKDDLEQLRDTCDVTYPASWSN